MGCDIHAMLITLSFYCDYYTHFVLVWSNFPDGSPEKVNKSLVFLCRTRHEGRSLNAIAPLLQDVIRNLPEDDVESDSDSNEHNSNYFYLNGKANLAPSLNRRYNLVMHLPKLRGNMVPEV